MEKELKKLKKENSELCSELIETKENIEFLTERMGSFKKRIRYLERKNTELRKMLKEKGCRNE
jgi:predicted RNase H-like nuclease (RuvC/YqgF family)